MDGNDLSLRLKFEPTPENAPRFAALIVTTAHEISGARLDFTHSSLKHVDRIVEEMRADAVPLDQIAETLFSFGCYVGEVIVRNTNGGWRSTADTAMEQFASWPMIVSFSEENHCNPIGKVFKLFDNGIEDSVHYFYTVFAKEHEIRKPGLLGRLFRK